MMHFETDEVMPSLGKLLNLPDSAVRIILRQIGVCKLGKDSDDYCINRKGIDVFKAKNKFNNSNIEVSECKINQKRRYYIRLGYCELNSDRIWYYCKRKDIISSPRILGGYRKAVKFITTVITNYFKTNDLVEVLLDFDTKELPVSDIEASAESSSISSDDSSSCSVAENRTACEIKKNYRLKVQYPIQRISNFVLGIAFLLITK